MKRINNKRLFTLGASILLGLWGSQVTADTRPFDVRLQASACVNCHQTHTSAIPTIAGRPESVLREQLLAFKADRAPSTIMHRLVAGYEESQLRALAKYFSQQAPTEPVSDKASQR